MLTIKERQVYNFIIKYQEKHGESPLLREVADGIGISSKGVAHRYIKSLEAAHMIAREPNKHRGLRAIDMIGKSKVLKLKSFGKIAAGGPIEAIPDKDIIELEHIFSNEKFIIERNNNKKSIRFGLSAIKGVGAKSIKSVITVRENNGVKIKILSFQTYFSVFHSITGPE